MKAKALYRFEVPGNHAVVHDGGEFVVSSKEVGVAVQNFLNNATTADIRLLHTHLLLAFKLTWDEESAMELENHVPDWMIGRLEDSDG